MAKSSKLRIGPNRLTAKPLSPAPRGMLAPKPPGQANNPGAVKRAAGKGKR
jgi:hypothetical protein